MLAAALGLAQGAVPALAVAHELAAGNSAGAVAHAEALGATHDSSAHAHDCGMCRNPLSKAGVPPRCADLVEAPARTIARALDDRSAEKSGDHACAALPRAPPVG